LYLDLLRIAGDKILESNVIGTEFTVNDLMAMKNPKAKNYLDKDGRSQLRRHALRVRAVDQGFEIQFTILILKLS
jgi:hypothetical protein